MKIDLVHYVLAVFYFVLVSQIFVHEIPSFFPNNDGLVKAVGIYVLWCGLLVINNRRLRIKYTNLDSLKRYVERTINSEVPTLHLKCIYVLSLLFGARYGSPTLFGSMRHESIMLWRKWWSGGAILSKYEWNRNVKRFVEKVES